MVKSIFKEIIIILLLTLAILLVLGIILYDYNPISKKVPDKVAEYSLSEEIENELSETINAMETQNIVKTYEITSADLKKYQATNDYDKGKVNPFLWVTEENVNTDNTQNTNNTENNQTNTNTANTSQGEFLNVVGK